MMRWSTVRRTPTLASEELSERAGGASALKAESLQRTGSFKLRGALNKLDSLGERAAGGLVTASAGNHGRAVAAAARLRGVACEVFMPRDAPVSKVAAVEGLGARVTLAGSSVDDAVELALAQEAPDGPAFVHPFLAYHARFASFHDVARKNHTASSGSIRRDRGSPAPIPTRSDASRWSSPLLMHLVPGLS